MRVINSLAVGLLVVLLAGCVTTTNQPVVKVDKEKALETHVELGLGYLRQRNNESSRLHFSKALKIDPNSAGALNGMALLYQIEKDDELAEKYFRKAISADGDYPRARNNYGAFLYGRERYQEAYTQFSIVAKNMGYERRSMALVNLGRASINLGKSEEAEKAFFQAMSINYRLPAAHLEMADMKFAAGDYAASKRYLDQYGKLVRHGPRSLWLGIQIERIFGNKDKEASYALALTNLYSYSNEYLEYKKTLNNDD
jgi:type IV pilus assembly protein PilF